MTHPTHLGRYKLESHLGSGAFADVYKATDQATDWLRTSKSRGCNVEL